MMYGGYLTPEMIEQLRAQAEEQQKIIVVKKVTDKCLGCGKFMSTNERDDIVFRGPAGPCHMTEACMTNMVIKFRGTHKEWDWDNGPQGGAVEGFNGVTKFIEENKLRKR